jgi:hypothetical protein
LAFASPKHIVVDSYDNLIVSDVDRVRYLNLHAKSVSVHGLRIPGLTSKTLHHFPNREVAFDLDYFQGLGILPKDLPVPVPSWLDPSNLDFEFHGLSTQPIGDLALDAEGDIFVADPLLHVVYRLNACGTIDVVAGNGRAPSEPGQGDGLKATAAPMTPRSLDYDRTRNVLLISDYSSPALLAPGSESRIRAVNMGERAVTAFAVKIEPHLIRSIGGGGDCHGGFACSFGDGQKATEAGIAWGADFVLAPDLRLYVSEGATGRIRTILPDGRIFRLAGRGQSSRGGERVAGGYQGDGGAAARAWFNFSDAPATSKLDVGLAWHTTGELAFQGHDLLVTDRSGRVREIHAVDRSPLAIGSSTGLIPGAGRGFTDPTLLSVDGESSAAAAPEITSGADGAVYATAGRGAGRGCDVWAVQRDADRRGHDRPVYKGQPGLVPSQRGLTAGVRPGPGGEDCIVRAGDKSLVAVTRVRARSVEPGDQDLGFLAARSENAGETWDGSIVAPARGASSAAGGASLAGDVAGTRFILGEVTGDRRLVIRESKDGRSYSAPTSVADHVVVLGDAGWSRGGVRYQTFVRQGEGILAGPEVAIARSQFGKPWTVHTVATLRVGASEVSRPAVAIDAIGSVYVTWSTDRAVSLARSTDGSHWQPPIRIGAADVSVLPAVAAGDAGKVAVAYYASYLPRTGSASNPYAEWYPTVAVSDDAMGSTPAFAERITTPSPVLIGGICVGSECSTNAEATDPTAVATGCGLQPEQCNAQQVALGPNAGPGRVRIHTTVQHDILVAYPVGRGLLGNPPGITSVGVSRSCTAVRLSAQLPTARCAEARRPSVVAVPPAHAGQNPLPRPISVGLLCSPVPPPFAVPDAEKQAPNPRAAEPHRHVSKSTPRHQRAEIRRAQPNAVLPPVIPEPPIEPALPPGHAPATSTQYSNAQQHSHQQANAPQTGLQVGLAVKEEAEAREARSFSASRRPTPAPLSDATTLLWIFVALSGSAVYVGARSGRSRPSPVVTLQRRTR